MKNKASRSSGSVVLGTSLIVAGAAFFLGAFVGNSALVRSAMPAFAADIFLSDQQPENVDFSPVWRAWNVIDAKYVATGDVATSTAASTSTDVISDEDKVWGLIQGLAASLGDPYTVFLPPSEAEVFEADISGSFEGVGMEIAIRDNTLTVVSPLKGTPAARAGILSGDRIIEINGTETRGMGIDEAVQRIRGPRGSDVAFTILREEVSEALEITVTRDVINIPTIETYQRADGIFVVEFLNFSAVSPNLFRDAMRAFVLSGSNMLVLDLRGNPGGYLQAAVDTASWFLPSGRVVVTEDYGDNAGPIVHRSRGYDIFSDDLQMIILLDRGSASASEILAGALQHYGIATLVGTPTFGKGSVQELIPITDTTALKVTVARWIGPGGDPIPTSGIEPDVEVKMTQEDIDAEKDPQMEKAVSILLGGE